MDGWFRSLAAQTPTRLWINNPTLEEAHQAIAAGAVSCTTNPTYCASMIQRDAEFALPVIDRIIAREPDDERAAHCIQQEMVARILPAFAPLQMRDPWQGVVSVQGDPRRDEDARHIIDEVMSDAARLAENFIAKIPVTRAGLVAIEHVLRQNIPVIATEVFGLAQMVEACELYERVCAQTGRRPAWFITHITGIFDEYLAQYVREHEIAIDPGVLAEAGYAACRRQHRLFKERKFGGVMLGGGARAMRHFTDFIGVDMHITINWSTAQEIIAARPAIAPRAQEPAEAVINELLAKLPDFRRAWDVDGLRGDEFAEYGPVLHFRDKFVAGWQALLGTIASRRGTRGH